MTLQEAKQILRIAAVGDKPVAQALKIVLRRLSPNSQKLEEDFEKKFKRLKADYEYDLRSFYQGYVMGRIDICYGEEKKLSEQKQEE